MQQEATELTTINTCGLTPKERLLRYLKYKRLSMNKFADGCQLDKSVVSRFGETTSQATLDKIQRRSDVNVDWLMTGEGSMLKTDQSSDKYDVPETEKTHQRLIPFYDVETTGGYEGKVSASDEGELAGYIQPGGWFDEKETAAIRHVGDSMVEYPNGCILAVRKVFDRRLLVYGRNYVIETREYRITKRVQKGEDNDTLMLYSTNTEKYEDGRLIHEPFSIALEDIINIYSVLGYIVNQMGDIRLIRTR